MPPPCGAANGRARARPADRALSVTLNSLLSLPGEESQGVQQYSTRVLPSRYKYSTVVDMREFIPQITSPLPRATPPTPNPHAMLFAVCGLHLRGGPLNHELVSMGGEFVRAAMTAAEYRMFAVSDARTPQKPALLRCPGGAEAGCETAAMPLELWDLPDEGVGQLLARVPPPLAFGTVVLGGGDCVKGFVAEGWVADAPMCRTAGVEAVEVTSHGGWNNFVRAREAGNLA